MARQEKNIKFFEYGEFTGEEYMQSMIRQAEPICMAKLFDAKLTFSGKYCGIADLEKLPQSKKAVVGMLYTIPLRRISSLSRKHVNYYKPQVVKVKVLGKDGKWHKAITIISDKRHVYKKCIPSSDYYTRMAEGYNQQLIDKRRIDKAVTSIPVNTIFMPKKKGGKR